MNRHNPVPPQAVEKQGTSASTKTETRANDTFLPDFATLSDSAHVRLPILKELFACSSATIWRWSKESRIPAPKKLGPRVSAWNVGELRQAMAKKGG